MVNIGNSSDFPIDVYLSACYDVFSKMHLIPLEIFWME